MNKIYPHIVKKSFPSIYLWITISIIIIIIYYMFRSVHPMRPYYILIKSHTLWVYFFVVLVQVKCTKLTKNHGPASTLWICHVPCAVHKSLLSHVLLRPIVFETLRHTYPAPYACYWSGSC